MSKVGGHYDNKTSKSVYVMKCKHGCIIDHVEGNDENGLEEG